MNVKNINFYEKLRGKMDSVCSILECLLDPKVGIPYGIIIAYSVYSFFSRKNYSGKSGINNYSLPVRLIFSANFMLLP